MTVKQTTRLAEASRQGHRWVGGLFLVVVAANFAALLLPDPPEAVVYLPLLPLALLMATGTSLLILPHRRSS